MPKSFKLKVVLVAFILLVCAVYIYPTLAPNLPAWWQSFLPTSKVRLGLDLQGGVHLLLEVDVDKAVSASVERSSQELYRRLTEEKVRLTQPEVDSAWNIRFTLLTDDDKAATQEVLDRWFGEYTVAQEPGGAYLLTLKPEAAQYIKEHANRQALETMRNRIDQFGVAEPEIVPQENNRILVQLPGVDDTERAIALIGKTAQLEFRLVEDLDARSFTAATVPPGTELLYEQRRDNMTGRVERRPLIVRSRASMTGEGIVDARANPMDATGEVSVSVSFNEAASRQFGDLTTRNVKRVLAIVLDGVVQSAPVIREPITGGVASISGDFTPEQARDLAVALRSGALPAPVNALEKRTVGPSLGRDSIQQGITATLIGGVLIFIFMLVYYKKSGIAADVALVMNIIILMAVMVAMGATLTLPGIAGIILTIGMAVDANVLINERIREELRMGKTPGMAVEVGYARATVTILDANITTILVAIVLYQFGTGPIKGFAVTLTIGLISSMFTAIFVTRMLFDYAIRRYRPKTLSI